jgi:hypothetical protein
MITKATDVSTDAFFGLKLQYSVFVTHEYCEKQGAPSKRRAMCKKQNNPLVSALHSGSFKQSLAKALVARKVVGKDDAKVLRTAYCVLRAVYKTVGCRVDVASVAVFSIVRRRGSIRMSI